MQTMSMHPEIFYLQHYKGLFILKRKCFNLMGGGREEGKDIKIWWTNEGTTPSSS